MHIGKFIDKCPELEECNNRLRDKIKEDVLNLQPDYILFTGDILDFNGYNNHECVALTKAYINEVSNNGAIKSIHCPGNHDKYISNAENFGEKRISLLTQKEINDRINNIKRGNSQDNFNKYIEFLESLSNSSNQITMNQIAIDSNIAYISINNSWFSEISDDMNQLYIGDAILETISKKIEEEEDIELNIIAIHHPDRYNNFREIFETRICEGKKCQSIKTCNNKECIILKNYKKLTNLGQCFLLTGHTHMSTNNFNKETAIKDNIIQSNCSAMHFDVKVGIVQANLSYFDIPTKPNILLNKIEHFPIEYKIDSFISDVNKFTDIVKSQCFSQNHIDILYSFKCQNKLIDIYGGLEIEPFQNNVSLLKLILFYFYNNCHIDKLNEELLFKLDITFLNQNHIKFEVDYYDLVQNKMCLVEKYFKELYFGKAESFQDKKLEFLFLFVGISGTNLFYKFACVLIQCGWFKQNELIISGRKVDIVLKNAGIDIVPNFLKKEINKKLIAIQADNFYDNSFEINLL